MPMQHQKNELNSPSLGSRIVSLFNKPKPTQCCLDLKKIWIAIVKLQQKDNSLMVKFERLDAAISGISADIDALKVKIDKLIVEAAEADAKVQVEVDSRAAKLEDLRGGSTGGI